MINLQLDLNDVNTILQALGNAPYAQVASVVNKITSQAGPQVEQQNAENKEEK